MNALVAFGTKYGSTAEVAQAIGKELETKGYLVEVRDLRQYTGGIKGFDLVVLGCAILMGKWTRPAQEFIERNATDLAATKVAMFVCCSDVLYLEKVDTARQTYLDDVVKAIPGCQPVSLGLFGGVIDFPRYGALTRALMAGAGKKKELKDKGVDIMAPYDYRDWGAIREWVQAL